MTGEQIAARIDLEVRARRLPQGAAGETPPETATETPNVRPGSNHKNLSGTAVGFSQGRELTPEGELKNEASAHAYSVPDELTADGWTGTLYPSLRCDYCGEGVWGNGAAALDAAKESHRKSCP